VTVAGLLLGATMPVLVSFGQQLLPDGQRVASSITMGATWGVGGLGVAATMAACNHLRRPELAFLAFAASTLVSSVICRWLPEPGANVEAPARDLRTTPILPADLID
jgi:FSR family fosmidomycin resistance protein-like MFS transporter